MNERDKLLLAGFAAGQDRTPESAIAMAEARAASTYQEPEKLDNMVPRSRLNAVEAELAEAKAKIKEVQENAWGLIEEFQKKLDALEASKVPANYPSVVTPEGDRGPVALNTLADELWNRLDGIDSTECTLPVEFCSRVIAALRSLKPKADVAVATSETMERAAWMLDCYVEFVRNVGASDLEAHPYLPEMEEVAQQLRGHLPAHAAVQSADYVPRFFIDHNMIHDRITGRHVHGDRDIEPGIADEAVFTLNELDASAHREILRATRDMAVQSAGRITMQTLKQYRKARTYPSGDLRDIPNGRAECSCCGRWSSSSALYALGEICAECWEESDPYPIENAAQLTREEIEQIRIELNNGTSSDGDEFNQLCDMALRAAEPAGQPRDVLMGESLIEYTLRNFREACSAWSDVRDIDSGDINQAKCDYASAVEQRAKCAIQELAALTPAQPEPTGDAAYWKAMYERERQAVFQAGRLLEGTQPEAALADELMFDVYDYAHKGYEFYKLMDNSDSPEKTAARDIMNTAATKLRIRVIAALRGRK